jgi:hypothetical protein
MKAILPYIILILLFSPNKLSAQDSITDPLMEIQYNDKTWVMVMDSVSFYDPDSFRNDFGSLQLFDSSSMASIYVNGESFAIEDNTILGVPYWSCGIGHWLYLLVDQKEGQLKFQAMEDMFNEYTIIFSLKSN